MLLQLACISFPMKTHTRLRKFLLQKFVLMQEMFKPHNSLKVVESKVVSLVFSQGFSSSILSSES